MKQCAFLSMHSLDAFESYDHLLVEPLARLNWEVTFVPWRTTVTDWNNFDAVVIRSPWDYQKDPYHFLSVLRDIETSTARLENSLELVRWNIAKDYLKKLQQKGIPIVPTRWEEQLQANQIDTYFEALDSSEIIFKPLISAGADDTFWIKQEAPLKLQPKVEKAFCNRAFMVQPFMPNILAEGEFSLFYFGRHYSHTILKVPQAGDFRVQEEHGGRLHRVEPEQALSDIARRTMQALPRLPLYARLDFVRVREAQFALMEVELIEPSLYFNMDPASPTRFAKHFAQWMQEKINC